MTTTRPSGDSRNDRAAGWLRWLPSPIVILTIALGGVMFALTVTKGVQDPDYFWHLTTGKLIAETGRVPSADPFSFTWFGQPWTPHEWLSELMIFRLVEAVGRIGALLVFGLFPPAIFGVLAAALTRQGARVLAIGLPFALGAFALIPYVTLRPQAISWLLIAVLLWILLEATADHPRRFLLVVPLFVLWANLHGLYVVGLGVVGVYLLFTLAGHTLMSRARGWAIGGTLAAVGASMLTPAGPIGILYPLRYIEPGDWGLANIQEWQSPNFHEPAHLAFLALIVAVGLNAGRRTPGWLVALSWIGVGLGLLALRNVPVGVVLCMPTLAMGLEARLRNRVAGRERRPLAPSRALGRRVMELIAAVAIAVGSIAVLVPRDMKAAIDTDIAERFPMIGVDKLLELTPDAKVFAEYGWGGYVIARMHEAGGRVFVDGRNDMYSQQILKDYTSILSADAGWPTLTDNYGVDALLLRPETTLTRGPASSAGWCEVYRDKVEVLYLPACPAN
ncbi:MAG: hypothetical protein H0W81_08300 [Chloroflexi bacterium]|nr:hypothetical protein [Chloroflexota bacterium]